MTEGSRFEPVTDTRPEDAPWPDMAWPPPGDLALSGRIVALRRADPEADAAPLLAAVDHEQVWRHTQSPPAGVEDYRARLRAALDEGRVPFVVRLSAPLAGLAPGAVVGTSSYLEVAPEDARLEIGATAYDPRVWGTAVNPDTKLTLLAYAFDQLGAGRVQLKTDVRNARSQQAIARLGARYEGTLRRHKRRADGTVRDTVMFSITAEDWPEVRAGLERRLASVSR